MPEAKHTPGPWVVAVDGGATVGFSVESDCGEVIAQVGAGWSASVYSESEANARLIAAAPDLLAACQELVEFVVDHCREEFLAEESTYSSMLNPARAAIAKATGATEVPLWQIRN